MKLKSPRTHQSHSPSPRPAKQINESLALAACDLGPLSRHHCTLPMKIYPYLSDHCEINEPDVKYVETCNL